MGEEQFSNIKLKVRKTQEGGLNCVSFFFVFSKLKTHSPEAVQEQLLK